MWRLIRCLTLDHFHGMIAAMDNHILHAGRHRRKEAPRLLDQCVRGSAAGIGETSEKTYVGWIRDSSWRMANGIRVIRVIVP